MFILDVDAIIKQALDRSPAYESIRNVLDNLNDDQVNLFWLIDEVTLSNEYI